MKIIIDAMGGDNAPDAIIEAVIRFLAETNAEVVLCGRADIINEKLNAFTYDKARLEVVDCTDEISDHDEPVRAVKQKKDASMVVAARLLSEGKGDAMFSMGNTGALLSAGILIVGRIKGVARPALGTILPTEKGGKFLIDAGANTNCRALNIVQFGVMGSLYMQKMFGIDNPKVGLINNGAEPEKGTDFTKEAHTALQEAELNFIGNIEGRDIMEGKADVMVCDGFTGNIVLKTVEGFGAVLNRSLKGIFKGNIINMLGALCVKKGLTQFKKRMDYREYGGAPILGLKRMVVKGHGSSDKKAVYCALMHIERATLSNITDEIAERLGE